MKDDGSVLASGIQRRRRPYVDRAPRCPRERITGIRLEALPDPSLPQGGPGRDYYGNFVLTGFQSTVA